MGTKIIKNSCNAGILSEKLSGRTDLSKYYNGCSQIVNGICLPQGGIIKRSGTEFIAKAKEFMPWAKSTIYPIGILISSDSNYYYCNVAHTSLATTLAAQIIANPTYWTLVSDTDDGTKIKMFGFEFSTDDVHTLEFGTRYMRVYKSGARVFETAQSIIDITLSTTDPVSVELTGHGYLTGYTIKFTDVGGTDELDDKEYIVIKTDDDNFTLYDTDSSDFTTWTSGGTTKKVYEITTPYSIDDVFELHKTQSADVMYIAHEDHYPNQLSRLGDSNWTLADAAITNGPFLSENTDALGILTFKTATVPVLKYSVVGVTGTLTASGTVDGVANAPFLDAHVGSLWALNHSRKDNNTSTPDNVTNAAPTTFTNAIRIKGNFAFKITEFVAGTDSAKLWRKEGNGEWTEYETFLSATSYSSTETVNDTYYAFTVSVNTMVGNLTAKEQLNKGVVKITAVTSSVLVTVEVMTAVYNEDVVAASYDSATSMWAEGAWSDYRGYPKTVSFYEDRLYWAGNTYKPQTLWGSATGEYLSHLTGNVDSDAIVLPMNANDISQIQWIAARKTMVVGTASTEFVISASNPDDPLTAVDKKSTPQSYIGSNNIQPVILNSGLFYLQRQGKKLNVMTFSYEIDSYKSENATILTDDIFNSIPTTMAVQLTPDSCLWITREDGVLCSFVYEPGEEVFAAWSEHVTGSSLLTPIGFFESVAVVHGTSEDEIWVSVKRIINSETIRTIEKFYTRQIDNVDDAMMMDSAKVVSSSFDSQNILLASDTIRCNEGLCNSSLCGGVPA